eukprot:gene11480-17660_t
MSAAGDKFMKELWRGKVPVQFSLANDSLAGMEYERPTSFYKLVPRVGYLSFYLPEIRIHLQHAAAQADSELWLSYDANGKSPSVPWHYPVGVIFDQLLLRENKETEEMLPLALSVHFTSYPDPNMISLKDEKETMALFSQHLKQAHVLRYNTTNAVTNLPMPQWNDLQLAIKDCNYAKYATVRTQLRRSESDMIKLPILLHYNDVVWTRAFKTAQGDMTYTLARFLKEVLPNVFNFTDAELQAEHPLNLPSTRLLVQGVSPALATPLVWLAEYMAHPDGFLHINIRTYDPPVPDADASSPSAGTEAVDR